MNTQYIITGLIIALAVIYLIRKAGKAVKGGGCGCGCGGGCDKNSNLEKLSDSTGCNCSKKN